jgi:hypothetical protein
LLAEWSIELDIGGSASRGEWLSEQVTIDCHCASFSSAWSLFIEQRIN